MQRQEDTFVKTLLKRRFGALSAVWAFWGRFKVSHPSSSLWQTTPRVGVNHRWLFLSLSFSLPWGDRKKNRLRLPPPQAHGGERAGTVKRTGRGKKRIESGLPCGFLRETVSICSSGPNLTVNTFHCFLFPILLYVNLHMHQGIQSTFAFNVCTVHH